ALLLKARPDDLQLLDLRCRQLFALPPRESALEFEKLGHLYRNARLFARAGVAYLRDKQPDAAAGAYREALALNLDLGAPGSQPGGNRLRHEVASQPDLFARVVAQPHRDPWLWAERAAILAIANQLDEADKALATMLEQAPDDPLIR